MAEEKLVEKEIIVATEPVAPSQRSLGRPMLMALLLIGVALAAIGILMAVLSN